MARRTLEYVSIRDLRPDPRNPKLHALDDLRASAGRFGYTEPILLDERTGLLVAGHGRRALLLDDLTGGDADEAIERAEDAAAKVTAVADEKPGRHPLFAEAMRLKKVGKRGAGRKLTDTELAAYIEGVKKADRGMSMSQELEVAYWVEKLALTRQRWVAVWGGEVREAKPAAAKGTGGGDRIATLNAKKAAAKAARDAGHPIPDEQLKSMTAEQADKVAEARRTHKAPAAKAS